MIYSDNFIWLHFPKCAGTKIEKIFEKYFSQCYNVYQDPVGIHKDPNIAWHDSIDDRMHRDSSFSINNKDIICSFRRLPSWLESRFNFEVFRNPQLPHNPHMLINGNFLEANGYQNHADYYVKKYLPEWIIATKRIRFIRTEFFESDFKLIFGDYLDVSSIPQHELVKKENRSLKKLPENIRDKLLIESNALYKNCPYWSYIESMAYHHPQ